jgi:DNA-binding XRE family transcriptional regulator
LKYILQFPAHSCGLFRPYGPKLRRLSDFTSDTDDGTVWSEVMVSTLRDLRHDLGLTQAQFARELNVALETYRPWDTDSSRHSYSMSHRAMRCCSDGER